MQEYEVIHTGNKNLITPSDIGATRIQQDSYVGKGTYGESNPNTLTFDFVPKIVFLINGLSGIRSDDSCMIPILFGLTKSIAFAGTTGCPITYEGTSMSWYSTESANRQGNTDGQTYYYVAIG